MKKEFRHTLGIVLLVALLCMRFVVELIIIHPIGTALMMMIYWGALAYSLCMLDLVNVTQHPAEKTTAAILMGLYCILLALHDQFFDYSEASTLIPNSFGQFMILLVLFSFTGFRGVKEKHIYSLHHVIVVFAILFFACTDHVFQSVNITYLHPRPDNVLYSVIILIQGIRLLTILPFMKPNAKSGTALCIVSTVGLGLYLLLEYSPLSDLSKGVGATFVKYIYLTLMPNVNLLLSFLFAGIWSCFADSILKNRIHSKR